MTTSLRPPVNSLLRSPPPAQKTEKDFDSDDEDIYVEILDERDDAESEGSVDETQFTEWSYKHAGTFAYLRAGSLDGSEDGGSDYCHESRYQSSEEFLFTEDEDDEEEWT